MTSQLHTRHANTQFPAFINFLSTLLIMVPFKRKRDEFEDSDDEEPSFGRQILPVANLPEDFNDEPSDGMQYLFTVRYVMPFLL